MSTEPSVVALRAVSALDGRYADATAPLSPFFSEFALMRYRVQVEVAWLETLASEPSIPEVRPLTGEETAFLRAIVSGFDNGDAERIKEIERVTNHDVKAIEYYLKERLTPGSLAGLTEWIHFACTSEDINNLAYALMMKNGIETVWLPRADELVSAVEALAHDTAAVALLARTHGQTASPTTLGKELGVFAHRWRRALRHIAAQEYLGKMNGAVGAFNAHVVAYPDAPWQEISRRFVEGLGLVYNPVTTQIEPHDYLAELFHALVRFNNITLDFDRDMWQYISMGYFGQKKIAG
ncbi:MAG: adenylosuccinate lyase, partial [Armatimonadetes bacterium]|nr:adenylosuccinate lyase [Armatimonadota bacterium]